MARRRYGLWLLNTALIAAALYAGLKWYAHYRLTGTLDRLAQQLEPQATLSYGDVETDLFARVAHVRRIELRPAQGPSPFGIDRVTVSGPGVWQMLFSNPFASSDRQNIPDRLSVLVDGVRVPTEALLAQAAEPAAVAPLNGGSSSDAAARPCQPNANLTPELLRAIGIVDPILDGELRWRLDDVDGQLETGMRMGVRKVQSFDMELVLGGIDSRQLRSGEVSTPPQLVSFELGWRLEPLVAQRFVEECAARLQLEPSEYRQRLIDGFQADLAARGLDLGPGLQAALAQFFREWGELRLKARPSEPVGVLSLAFVPPPQLARQLGLQLAINDTIYADLDFRFSASAMAQERAGPGAGPGALLGGGALGALIGGSVAPPQIPDADDESFYPEPARIEYRYFWRRVPLPQLSGHLDRTSRVHLNDGRVREGRLTRVGESEIVVVQHLYGGKFSMPVPRQDIAFVEVRMREALESQTPAAGGRASASQ